MVSGLAEETGIKMRSYVGATRRWIPVVVIGGLLGVAALAASIATPGIHRTPFPAPSAPGITDRANNPFGGGVTAASPVGAPGAALGTPWQAWLLATIVFGVALVLAVFLLRHLIVIRRRPIRRFAPDREGLPEALSARRDMIAALDDGIARLAVDGDARSAVIACWVRLEEVAQTAGIPRVRSDAPAELVTRLLDAHEVSSAALTSLADLYRAARYGTKPIDNPMREQALSALSTVRSDIAASVTMPTDERQTIPSQSAWWRP